MLFQCKILTIEGGKNMYDFVKNSMKRLFSTGRMLSMNFTGSDNKITFNDTVLKVIQGK